MSVSRMNIYKIVRNYEELETVKDAPKSGPPKISRRDETFIDMNNVLLIQDGATSLQVKC